MIAITGAGGFIGGHLVKALVAAGRDDLVLVERGPGMGRLADAWPNLEHLTADSLLQRLRRGDIEVILHQGACSDTMESNWGFVFTNNWRDNQKLLSECLHRDVRLIYASSAAVYGHGNVGFTEGPRCEAPLNVYGLSKLLFDLHVRLALDRPSEEHLSQHRPQVVGLRYFNVYGPGEGHKGRMASMVHQLREQAKSTGKMRLFAGSEGFRRDFVSVHDVVLVNLFFLAHPEISGIFNVGTGKATSFTELAELIRSQLPARIKTIPFPENLRGRYQAHTCADLTALRRVGYERNWLGFDEGIKNWSRLDQASMQSDGSLSSSGDAL